MIFDIPVVYPVKISRRKGAMNPTRILVKTTYPVDVPVVDITTAPIIMTLGGGTGGLSSV